MLGEMAFLKVFKNKILVDIFGKIKLRDSYCIYTCKTRPHVSLFCHKTTQYPASAQKKYCLSDRSYLPAKSVWAKLCGNRMQVHQERCGFQHPGQLLTHSRGFVTNALLGLSFRCSLDSHFYELNFVSKIFSQGLRGLYQLMAWMPPTGHPKGKSSSLFLISYCYL